MNRAGDHDDRLAFIGKAQGIGGGGAARIGEALLDVAVMLQIFDVGGGRNNRGDLRTAFDGLAKLAELDAVGGFFERLEVGDDFVPIEELVIDSDFMAEVGFGSGDGGEGDRNRENKETGFHVDIVRCF